MEPVDDTRWFGKHEDTLAMNDLDAVVLAGRNRGRGFGALLYPDAPDAGSRRFLDELLGLIRRDDEDETSNLVRDLDEVGVARETLNLGCLGMDGQDVVALGAELLQDDVPEALS
jgi:predicted GNAT superfamily acetyltransferase